VTTDTEQVARRAEQLGAQAIELAQALVRTNTVNRHSGDAKPGNEGDGQRLLSPLLQSLGCRLDWFDCPQDIYARMGVLGPRDRDFSDRPNLIAELAFGTGGPTIVLQGHMDTVGIEGMSMPDPLSGDVREGRLWGRGSTDMKGGLAAAVTALRALHDFRHELQGRVILASVVEEECNGSGAGALSWIERACAGRLFGGAFQPRVGTDGKLAVADAAICTDGTGPEVLRGYGGVLTVDVQVEGRPGHPARSRSVSAIDKALAVKEAIDRYKSEREQLGPGRNVNLGLFRGGTHPSMVAASALMSLNMSYPYADAVAAEAAGAGFGNAPGRARFEALIRERAQADEWLRAHPPRVDWIKDLIPFELPEAHPLVQQVAAMHRRVLGQEPVIDVNPAWSDACYLAGHAGTPALCYGAGSPDQAHGAAESVETWRIVDCARVLAAFLFERLRS